MRDMLVGYWPLWLLAGVLVALVVIAWSACRAAARALHLAVLELDERAAARALRPSPAPIDVERMR